MSTDNCTNFSPPWFTGRWRDWHRGHGCNLDDGKPRSLEGQAEIERGMGLAASCDHPVVLDSFPPTCGVCGSDLVERPDDIARMAARAGVDEAGLRAEVQANLAAFEPDDALPSPESLRITPDVVAPDVAGPRKPRLSEVTAGRLVGPLDAVAAALAGSPAGEDGGA